MYGIVAYSQNWYDGVPERCADMDENTALWMDGYMASPRCVAISFRCDGAKPCGVEDKDDRGKKTYWDAMACFLKLRAICQTAPHTSGP